MSNIQVIVTEMELAFGNHTPTGRYRLIVNGSKLTFVWLYK